METYLEYWIMRGGSPSKKPQRNEILKKKEDKKEIQNYFILGKNSEKF